MDFRNLLEKLQWKSREHCQCSGPWKDNWDENKYNKMIFLAKRNYYRQEFKNHKGNTKYLYKLMSKLTAMINANSMLDRKSNNDIAEDIAEYVLQKLWKSGMT